MTKVINHQTISGNTLQQHDSNGWSSNLSTAIKLKLQHLQLFTHYIRTYQINNTQKGITEDWRLHGRSYFNLTASISGAVTQRIHPDMLFNCLLNNTNAYIQTHSFTGKRTHLHPGEKHPLLNQGLELGCMRYARKGKRS